MGAYGLFDLLSRCPRFSTAIAIAGAGDPIFAPVMWRTRFWIFHSESDDQAADAVRCPPVRALLPRGAACDLRCIAPRP